MATTRIEFCLLGAVQVRNGEGVLPVQPGKQRAVLAALLLRANEVVSIDELAEVLWGPAPPPSARVTIQNYVLRLRKALRPTDGPRISTRPRGYLIQVEPDELDVARFEARLTAARAAAQDSSWAAAATQAREALALWRGDPLADVDSELLAAREVPRLTELRQQAVELRIDADLHLGRHAEVIAELRQLTAEHPLRERLHGLLMLALYRDGRQAEALAAYRQARIALVDELGAEPGTGLRLLHQQILTSDTSLDVPDMELPAAGAPGPPPRPGRPEAGQPAGPRRPVRSRRPWWRMTHRTGWAGGAAVLVLAASVGAVLASLSSAATPTAGRTSSTDPRVSHPPVLALGPVCGAQQAASARPGLCVTRSQGTPATVFTVRERGFEPGTKTTIRVIFYPPPTTASAQRPVTLGTYTGPANHSFRLGPFRGGLYRVVEAGAGAAGPSTAFRVLPFLR